MAGFSTGASMSNATLTPSSISMVVGSAVPMGEEGNLTICWLIGDDK